MSKVFVTGAAGMLGSNICRELLRQNYEVVALSLDEASSKTISDLPIEIVYGDILDYAFLKEQMRDCDYIIHVAALTQVWPRRDSKINDVNICGTKIIVKVAQELGVKRMVHIGSAASFTEGSKQNPGDERSEYTGWRFGMDYIDSKYKTQKYLLRKHSESNFQVVIVNPTYMIGPFDSGPSSGKMLIEFSKGSLPGYSGGGKNFVCSTDVACAAVNAIHNGRPGQCYIAGNENLEYKEFFQKISYLLDKELTLKKIPQAFILLAGLYSSIIARVTGKKPKLSYGMAKFASLHQYYNSNKAVEELNMPQTPINVGIEQAYEWFNENKYLDRR